MLPLFINYPGDLPASWLSVAPAIAAVAEPEPQLRPSGVPQPELSQPLRSQLQPSGVPQPELPQPSRSLDHVPLEFRTASLGAADSDIAGHRAPLGTGRLGTTASWSLH